MNTRRRFEEPGLQYELSSTPSPLQASPADPTKPLAKAELIVIASNQKNAPANVASISISFDIAPSSNPDDATYLTSIGTGIGFDVMGDPDQAVWNVSNDGAGTFTATAKAGSVPIASQGLAFLISNIQPNRSVGTFDLTITETLLGGAANAVTLQDSKFPFEFTLDNFRADSTQVGQGLATTLRWDGSVGATLKIFHTGTPVDVTGTNSWPTGTLTQDTEFVLQASIGDVALATWSLTVQVGRQILELTSLTVDQGTTLKGAATVGTAAANASLTVNGDAGVSGGFTAKTATIIENLAVKQWLDADQLNVRKTLTGNSAQISLLNPGQGLGGPGTFLAHTDGFVVGNVLPPRDVWAFSMCWMKLSNDDGVFAHATGGNHACMGKGPVTDTGGNANSAILPVRAGTRFYLSIVQSTKNNDPGVDDAPTASWWVPLGTAPSGETLTKISDAVPEAHRARIPDSPAKAAVPGRRRWRLWRG